MSTKINPKCRREFIQKMSTKIHPKRGNTERFLGVDTIYMIDTKPQLYLAYCQFTKNNFEAVLGRTQFLWHE